ncbi:hypothetical protein GE061_003021 [Apolygus lucorum]|uniref:Uncharacterized protein n=1 Tax=Apolygus lucorum TaxID=248454 RepID=A0A8S9X0U0_APOLU|nr:hypothetical protein GE061_003021 [Apolygus lucorum]
MNQRRVELEEPGREDLEAKGVRGVGGQEELDESEAGGVRRAGAGGFEGERSNEVGTPLSRLQLDPGSLSAVLEAAKEGGSASSTVRLNVVPPGATEVTTVAGYLCKKCRLTFPREASVTGHGCGPSPGSVALLRVRAGCKLCDAVLDGPEYRRHVDAAHSESEAPPAPTAPAPPLSPRLSVEMEDVVNQITALAAQTLKPGADPNANVFDKFPVPSAGQ